MTLDSQTPTIEQDATNASPTVSDPGNDEQEWIEPANVRNPKADRSELTNSSGMQTVARPPAQVDMVDAELAEEFDAWESASDEALALFESKLE